MAQDEDLVALAKAIVLDIGNTFYGTFPSRSCSRTPEISPNPYVFWNSEQYEFCIGSLQKFNSISPFWDSLHLFAKFDFTASKISYSS
ncbi:hypothetical protein D3C72_2228380 [compost metagenome]